MRLNSLEFRLLATSAAWALIVLPLAWLAMDRIVREDARRDLDIRAQQLVQHFALETLDPSPAGPQTPKNTFEPLFEQTHSGWYWQVTPVDDPGGKVLVSQSLATGRLPLPVKSGIAPDSLGHRWMQAKGPAGDDIRLVEELENFGHDPRGTQYSVIVSYPAKWIETRADYIMPTLTKALALTGIGLVAMTMFQVRFGLLPLQKIERGLAAIRSGEATALPEDLPAEIEPLQQELNALIQANQDIVERARTQVGNLAHALKTPLAVITNEAGDNKGPFAGKVAEQAGLMRDQINHYLDRARMAARVGIGRSTDVRATAEPLVRALERIHRDRDVRVTCECPAGVRFQGEKHDLEEMLGNLLDNACKWARRNVYLTVTGPARDAKGPARRVVILVEDDGRGLSEDQRKKIGKRGLRLDETKPGSGLGLSIVTDLVQSYRGRFELAQSGRGGLLVRVELPAV
jgi:signal transduction histidine kinase